VNDLAADQLESTQVAVGKGKGKLDDHSEQLQIIDNSNEYAKDCIGLGENSTTNLTSRPVISTTVAGIGKKTDDGATEFHPKGEADNEEGSKRLPDPFVEAKDPDRFSISPVLVKDSSGVDEQEIALFDTGSSSNWVSRRLIEKHKWQLRPLKEPDIETFTDIHGKEIRSEHYVQVTFSCKERGAA
jgi:hypothetical protein